MYISHFAADFLFPKKFHSVFQGTPKEQTVARFIMQLKKELCVESVRMIFSELLSSLSTSDWDRGMEEAVRAAG